MVSEEEILKNGTAYHKQRIKIEEMNVLLSVNEEEDKL